MNNLSKNYTVQRLIHAPRELVFQLLISLNGLSTWLTNPGKGSTRANDEISFSFNRSDEASKMRVDLAEDPSVIQWSVLKDSMYDGAWVGTIILFELLHVDKATCLLHFRHIGLTPDLAVYEASKRSWEHFIGHLIMVCEKAGAY